MNGKKRVRVGRWVHGAVVACILLYLVAPAIVVIPMSFMGESMRRFPDAELSLDAYRRFFHQPGWLSATSFSVTMSSAVMVLSVIIAAATAYGISGVRPTWQRVLSILVLLPIVVPTIVFAIAIYWLLARLGLLGSFAGFVIANLVLALPYAFMTLRNGVAGLDLSLLRAAAVLGAKPGRVLFRVVIPLLTPALVAGCLFSFLIAFDEVVVAQFVSGPSAVPVSKQMWDGILFRWDPAISAISTMQIAITLAVLLVGLVKRHYERRVLGR